MATQFRAVEVAYVDPIPKERSGIGQDVPAHVKLFWHDKEGRRCSYLLLLPEESVEFIKNLPDGRPECASGRVQHSWVKNFEGSPRWCKRCGARDGEDE